MIDFRYHVVSIVAVFLALALGLFIGSTSLRGRVANDISHRTHQVLDTNNRLQGELSTLRGQLNRSQAFDGALLPYAVAGKLAGESVTLVSAPGVDGGLRSRVQQGLVAAGATVTGDVRLQDDLLDPEREQFLATLTGRLTPPKRTLPAGNGVQRALALLADVIGTRPQRHPVSAAAATRVLSAYGAAKLVSVSGSPPHPSSLAVLLAGPAPSADDTAAATRVSELAGFAGRLDHATTGAVVTGPTTAADKGGLLDVLRDDAAVRDTVSTVDSAELPSGVIATVLALAEQARGGAGSYGVAPGADAPLPTPSPS